MKYRVLGKTELKVSAIGFGGIAIQRVDSNQAAEIVNAALDKGINFFDTARGYTDSEVKLGKALKTRRSEAIIATKSMNRTKAGMAKDIRISLDNMGTDYIDLYQLHNVKDYQTLKQVLAPDGALEALIEAKEAGLVRHIGITGHIKDVLKEALANKQLETVQFPFNPVETEGAKELLELAEKARMGVIIMKPLAGGAFSQAESSLKFILSHQVSTVIPGMDSVEQVNINAAVASGDITLAAREKTLLDEEVGRLGNTFCRRCEYCQPCPEGVNIPAMFLLEGYYDRYNLQQWARERYWAMDVKAEACQDCGECEERCPYDLPIREMLSRVGEKLDKQQ
ncbi:aldo/keto reductase [Metallumcola ferriviriculae]|uniref:Aldo/keto reductase n=1 Tax=Metallumcola ferriviriculae TaxID=3039180 RepID=A0AAU0ULT5_9FIRM|nr:aldo/keto reductase [Desulfitibacteraceae bacterium MK1]